MQSANDWQRQPSDVDFEVLSSMISELVRHHEQQLTGDEYSLDWESPSARTRIVKFASTANLYNVVNQIPNAVAVEYQLIYEGVPVFSWHEYRWPHLQDTQQSLSEPIAGVPQACIDELMRYHLNANTSWLSRYRNRLCRKRPTQIDEVGVMAKSHRLRAL
ncbi:MAG: hypothetical protein AB8B64_09905 [Granulosicoccus sp.]